MATIETRNLPEFIPSFIRDLWSETLNSISKSEDEVRDFTTKLVDRGKLTQDEAKTVVQNMIQGLDENRTALQTKLNEGMDKVLARINIPSKTEIEKLSKRVDSLSTRVNQLKKKAA